VIEKKNTNDIYLNISKIYNVLENLRAYFITDVITVIHEMILLMNVRQLRM